MTENLSTDTPLDTLVHRSVAKGLAQALKTTPFTPNALTILSLVSALVAAWLFLKGQAWMSVAGLVFFYGWAVLDHADGELARVSGKTSEFGKKLDDLCDHIASIFLHLGIFFGLLPFWNQKDKSTLTQLFIPALVLHVLSLIFVSHEKMRYRLKKFSRNQKILDHFTGRETFYILILGVIAAQCFKSTFWYSGVMGVFIIGLGVLSFSFFVTAFKMRYNTQHE